MTFLVKQFGGVEFSEAEIDRCIGILKTNGMKLEHGGLKQSSGVVLYPIYCLINSACVSNTNHIKTETLELQVTMFTNSFIFIWMLLKTDLFS